LTIDASIVPISVPNVTEMATSHLFTGGRSGSGAFTVFAPRAVDEKLDERLGACHAARSRSRPRRRGDLPFAPKQATAKELSGSRRSRRSRWPRLRSLRGARAARASSAFGRAPRRLAGETSERNGRCASTWRRASGKNRRAARGIPDVFERFQTGVELFEHFRAPVDQKRFDERVAKSAKRL
jgi:hypothetical protein